MSGRDVLLARFLALGDVLLLLPLIETLARSSGVRSVDVVTSSAFGELLEHSPRVGRVFQLHPDGRGAQGLRDRRYDVLLDLHMRSAPLPGPAEALLDEVRAATRVGFLNPDGATRQPQAVASRRFDEHAVEAYARCAGTLIDQPLADGLIDIARSDVERAAARLPDRAVCIAPGARYPWKRWPATRFADLMGRLRQRGLSPVLVGHPADREYINSVRRSCPSAPPAELSASMYALAAVLRASGIVVANNSGMAHLGQVAGARVTCVHSHTLPEMWRPWGSWHENVRGEPGRCRCTGLSEFERATPCGLSIDPAQVADAVARTMDGEPS
jgi:ADP-heptose:LPS heptosyltransferase